jgi:hypothetical protein
VHRDGGRNLIFNVKNGCADYKLIIIKKGVCGGPVVLMQDIQQCIGMVEASVAPLKKGDENNEAKVFLQDKAVIIPSTVIIKFLQVFNSPSYFLFPFLSFHLLCFKTCTLRNVSRFSQ